MDAPIYESFPSQSWESWHDIGETETITPLTTGGISFDADAIVRQAVAQRGSAEEQRSMGIVAIDK